MVLDSDFELKVVCFCGYYDFDRVSDYFSYYLFGRMGIGGCLLRL
jgi:hypothetical protein